MLHYKTPPSVSGDIYGLDLTAPDRNLCSEHHKWGGFVDGMVGMRKGLKYASYDALNISTDRSQRVRFEYKGWVRMEAGRPYVHSVAPAIRSMVAVKYAARLRRKPA